MASTAPAIAIKTVGLSYISRSPGVRSRANTAVLNLDLDLQDVPERALLTDLGLALYKSGMPTHSIEEDLSRAARGLLVPVRVFCLPTELTIKFLRTAENTSHTVNERPTGGLNTQSMHRLDDFCEELSTGALDVATACAKLDAIMAGPPYYNQLMILIAFALSALAPVLLFFGGAPIDGAFACCISLICGFLDAFSGSRPRLARLQNFIAGALAGFLARSANTVFSTCTVPVALGGVIWYLPGFSITVAM
jgi:uncharacterized membrane protein YjjP (DUF1212 family)